MENTAEPFRAASADDAVPAPAPRAPSVAVLFARSVAGSVSAVALSVVVSVLTLRAGYAGASDDTAASEAVAKYDAFLTAIVRALALTGVVEAVCLAPITLGLVLLLECFPRTRRVSASGFLGPMVVAWLSVFAYFVIVAHRHPGLFLSTVAGSHVLTLATRYGHVVASIVFALSAAGYVSLFVRDAHARAGKILGGVLLAFTIGGVLGFGRLPGPHRVFGASGLESLKGVKRRPANVLILAVDSLRPDMIDALHTPNILRLVEESVYFPNALVTVPRTGPSWAATLTSMSPLLNGIETMFPTARLGKLKTLALPAHLASLGYRTAVFSEYAGEFFGRVDFGFQVNAVPTVELKEIAGQMLLMRAPTVLAAAGQLYMQGDLGRRVLGSRVTNLIRGMSNFSQPEVLLRDVDALSLVDQATVKTHKAPFFSLIFYSQPHFPYTSSSEFYSAYHVPGSSPELAFGRDATSETPISTKADHEQVIGLYRAALAETDAAVGKLLENLAKSGELERTIIVLMADHGEGLYECSTCVGHGDNLRSMLTLRVPLAFRLPSNLFSAVKASREEAYVSQLDVYPTVLSLLGKKALVHHEGMALLDDHGRPVTVPERTHFAETGEWLWPTPAVPKDRVSYPPITQTGTLEGNRIVIDEKYNPEIRAAKYRAVIRAPYKLSYEPGEKEVRYRLYRIDEDPYEEHDLAAQQPKILTELKGALTTSMIRHPKILPVGGYFLTRPDPPEPESW
jgi:arylsulfatase A-like enzyme